MNKLNESVNIRWPVYFYCLLVISVILYGVVMLFHDVSESLTNWPTNRIITFFFISSAAAMTLAYLDREIRRLNWKVRSLYELEKSDRQTISDLKDKWRKSNSDCNDQRLLNWSRATSLEDLNQQLDGLSAKLTGVEDRCASAEVEVEFWRNKSGTTQAADIYLQLTSEHKTGCDAHGGLVQYVDYLVEVEKKAYQLAEIVDSGGDNGKAN